MYFLKRSWILLFLMIVNCVDKIEVDTSTEPDRIVIDGFITSEESNHLVKVIKTNKFSNLPNTPVENALVKIIDSNGNEEILNEVEPGSYETRSDFKAEVGIDYIVHVETEGKIIESYEERLPEFVPFDSVYYKTSASGMTIYSYIQGAEGNKRYFLWDLENTFIWEAPFARSESTRQCWVTNITAFQDIVVHEDVEGGYEHEITFIKASSDMEIFYSLLVTQYNISEEAYDFWSSIKKQRESVGSIFDPPPYSIVGNLYNTQNSKDPVLGFFGVYHKSESRLSWDIFDIPYNYDFQNSCASLFFGRPPECINCLRYTGGTSTNIPPEWWNR